MSTLVDDSAVTLDLAAKAMAGDAAALQTLWQRHRRYAAAVILVYKPASSDVEDLLQEVALAVVAKIGTLGDPAAFVPWLRVIAMNAGRLAGRKLKASPVKGELDSPAGAETRTDLEMARRGQGEAPADELAALAQSDTANDLLALASKLPDEYREPLLMKCLGDMSYRQIGAVLGLPETTIETRIARGRRMLRELAKARQDGLRIGAKVAPAGSGQTSRGLGQAAAGLS